MAEITNEFEMLNYRISDNIKSRIPEYFYFAFGGEFVSIFGKAALVRDEDGLTSLNYNTGTTGYVVALQMACKKLDVEWLFDYYRQLPWYQSDLFDSELADEVISRFDMEDNANPYYQFLLNQKVKG
ncbi:hypothetical protein AALD01_02215 [Oscillospiraceae bacterium 21-37]